MRMLLWLCVALSSSSPLPAAASITRALTVEITSPSDGAIVSGVIVIQGTSSDVGSGMVSVSIDNGPFVPAQGTDNWTFTWDTTQVSDGSHQIRARARQFIGGPEVFDTIAVIVDNTAGLAIAITSPASGANVLDTFVVQGTSNGAIEVSLAVDNGPFQLANGIETWSVVIEPGAITPGDHVLLARATDGTQEAFDSIAITVGDPSPGVQSFAYVSSVDGVAMTSKLWIPAGFDPNGPEVPLVIHLHGGGGLGSISPDMSSELDARGWVGIAPDGRAWNLANQGCPWQTSAAYVDNPDPDVGPGEQDILDAIDWVSASLPIDQHRVYLTGFSMGGRGTYSIGLKNPDRFAAIAPMGPAIDMYEIFVRRPEPAACKEGMVGGQPGDSPFVDTMYSITSGRFLIENAYALPVYHGHGLLDTIASNTASNAPFLHGWHITSDTSWNGCHDAPDFCFGHTPTLSELRARHPQGYDWAFMFTDVAHTTDPRWLHGTPVAPGIFGVVDPQDPVNFLGIYEFFDRHVLVDAPETVVYKTYEDQHRSAWWIELLTSTPWLDTPAAIRATRDPAQNRLDIELVRAARAEFDLQRAGLTLAAAAPVVTLVDELVEPVFDPALAAPGELLAPLLEWRDDAATLGGATVLLDGVAMAPSEVVTSPTQVTVGPVTVDAAHLIEVYASETYCVGAPNSVGEGARIAHSGTASLARNDFVLTASGLPANTVGIFFYGAGEIDVPFGNGRLCVAAPNYRLLPIVQSDAFGNVFFAADSTQPPMGSGPGQVLAGSTWRFQCWYRDSDAAGAGGATFNTSNALRVPFVQ